MGMLRTSGFVDHGGAAEVIRSPFHLSSLTYVRSHYVLPAWPSQNTKTRYIAWMVAALSDVGSRIVSATIRDPALYPRGSPKSRDITGRGGLASLTGMEIWELVTFLPIIFRMTLIDEHMMVSAL